MKPSDGRYGGNVWLKGAREDPALCVDEVWRADGWGSAQCRRKRGYGPNGEYCQQHAKRIIRRTPHDDAPIQ